jgi:hypothetical protein
MKPDVKRFTSRRVQDFTRRSLEFVPRLRIHACFSWFEVGGGVVVAGVAF